MKLWQKLFLFFIFPPLLIGGTFLYEELKTSRWQAEFFSTIGRDLRYTVEEGPAPRESTYFPESGPYDIRLGYTHIPTMMDSLVRAGFSIDGQARMSRRLRELIDWGVFPIYKPKSAAGLSVFDRRGRTVYHTIRPERLFESFEDIPQSIVTSLLFIENRDLLDREHPFRNPAIEWDRLGKAVLEKFIQIVQPDRDVPGGSTVATQLEKYQHSPEGRTQTAKDKLQQMLSASFRAYLDGERTYDTRKDIALRYMNSIPLAALPGFGEVTGLGDGLWAWYGVDFDEFRNTLRSVPDERPADAADVARLYKQGLSLFIAHRRPSMYLLGDPKDLNELADSHLNLLAANGVIPKWLRDEALTVELKLRRRAATQAPISFIERKTANSVRTSLLKLLKVPQLYDLDQFDLTAWSTLDLEASERVSQGLKSLYDPETLKKIGLTGEHTLGKGDPKKVIYSFTLYETVNKLNLLRVQTDNMDKPFNLNEGARLDLGSTAKLRTLVSYLEVITEVFHELRDQTKEQRAALLAEKPDVLTSWVIAQLGENPGIELQAILDAAMERKYSASPGEAFFTGGGMHTFVNFKKEDNGKVPSVSEAIRHSINLPFIRIMRDVVNYYRHKLMGSETADSRKERRKFYLSKFADKEGGEFLEGFYRKYRGRQSDEMLSILVRTLKPAPRRLVAMYRYVRPTATLDQLAAFVEEELPKSACSESVLRGLYEEFVPGKFSLNDQGYLARVHPLELWLVRYMTEHPNATFSEVTKASVNERQEVYSWLFKTPFKRAQDSRIRSLIEIEAFLQIHKTWRRLGYPFSSMVPSLASSIGSSGDRPAALAELMGIILNDGIRYPTVRIDQIAVATDTPFETIFTQDAPEEPEQVLRPEITKTVKRALMDIVQNGTARRVNGAFTKPDGKPWEVGGKTGTGDHRFETFGAGGRLISSRVVNRTATFVFFIGQRFFGTITAHVHGEDAADYDFTSALAAGLLKALAPNLNPLINEPPERLPPSMRNIANYQPCYPWSPGPEAIRCSATPECSLPPILHPVRSCDRETPKHR